MSQLTAAQIALLDTQLPEIGGAIRGEPVTPAGDGWRIGSSTKISKNGRWYDFKLQQGGFGAVTLIVHYGACTPEEAATWAQSWLAQHPQPGPCGGADEDDDAKEDSADTLQRRAYIEATYAARLPIAGTPAETYLTGRGLDPAQLRPEIVERMGWLANYRGTEGALVFPYTDEAGGLQGLHYIFVTPTGEKSPLTPARMTRRGSPKWRTAGRALLRFDFGAGPEMTITEGLENALAVSLTGADRVVAVGAVNAYGRCRLPDAVETVVLAHDGDDPATKAAAVQAYHRGVVRYLGQGLTLRMTSPPIGRDPNDVLKRDGPDALKKLLAEARCDLGKFDNAAFLNEICRLDELSYDRARATALKLLHLNKLDTLDKERQATRRRWAETPGGTEIPPVPDDDQPWPDPVTDIGPVLDIALAETACYVVALQHQLATAMLWGAHVHLLPRADLGIDVAPRLGIRSEEPDSGKSTLLECVHNITPNPILSGSITPSSLFRIIDATHATLFIDEADQVIHANSSPDLLALLNSGHRRKTAYAIRSVPGPDGKSWVPTQFNTFAGIAFAGLKSFPETLQSRTIGIPLHKATREEGREHLINGYSPVLVECRRKLARWSADLTELPAATMPPELFNRMGDNWRGLLAVAEAAGGVWPDLARQAALAGFSEGNDSLTTQLLDAVWQIFAKKKAVRLHTKVLLDALKAIEEAPWETANNGRDIDSYWLRERLKGFLPRPANPKEAAELRRSREWKDGTGSALKGYTEAHLREAWWRYLERKTPTETRKAAGDAERPAAEDPTGNGAAAAADEPDEASATNPPIANASTRPGPARRRTRPGATKPPSDA
jgi:hypothetical protein